MAVGAFTLYRKNIDDMRLNDLLTATVKAALVKSTYTPDATNTGHSLWSEVSAEEIANGNGYTTGGLVIASDTVNAVANGFNYDTEDFVWTASGGSIPVWRYMHLYVLGTLWGMTNPLIGYFLGDTAPADVPATTSGNPLTIVAPAGGWFAHTQA